MILLTYGDHKITCREKLLSLTDMWRAAGSPEHREPFQWARKEGSEFIGFVRMTQNLPEGQVIEARRGRGGGTFAYWQIALAYAQYLSPEFHAWCNTVVRERMEDRASGGLTDEQAELLRRADGICRMLSHKVAAMEHTIEQLLGERIEAVVTARLSADPRVAVLDYKPMIDILQGAGVVHAKDRGKLSRRCARMMLKFYSRKGFSTRVSPETGRWLFHLEGVEPWLAHEGRAIISNHIATVSGQYALHLVSR